MIAGLLLAAGRSERFGGDKLLAPLRGQPVVRWSAAALAAAVDALYVVVRAGEEGRSDAVRDLSPAIVRHATPDDGMASSLRAGIAALSSDVEAAVVALGDQPLVPQAVVRALCVRWREGGAAAVAPLYRDGRGHPVLFGRELFPALALLRGDSGARGVLDGLGARLALLPIDDDMPVDVDTPAALKFLADGTASG
jgi:molybdenum cofactor cytidylyltransferase